ncbi:MAG: hypothetical protein OEV08_14490, partial [Nitrospira sp.]|nr:hypothetical protein [Nitrospira sp.]
MDQTIYIDVEFEKAMFRYHHTSGTYFRKFYGDSKEMIVPRDNRLLNDALRDGLEIDATAYALGKSRPKDEKFGRFGDELERLVVALVAGSPRERCAAADRMGEIGDAAFP